MQIRACPGGVVTTPPNQALGDTGLAFLEKPPVSPRHPVPGGRNQVSKLWAQRPPPVPVWCGVPVASRGKKSLLAHPAGKTNTGSS